MQNKKENSDIFLVILLAVDHISYNPLDFKLNKIKTRLNLKLGEKWDKMKIKMWYLNE